MVLDHVGPALWEPSLFSLAPQGRLVTCGNTTGDTLRSRRSATCSTGHSILGSDPYRPQEFARRVAAVLRRWLRRRSSTATFASGRRGRRPRTRCCAATSSARSCSSPSRSMADSPYPELKKTHTMARDRVGRGGPQAAAAGAGVGDHPGLRQLLDAGGGARPRRVRRALQRTRAGSRPRLSPSTSTRHRRHLAHLLDALVAARLPRPGRRSSRADRRPPSGTCARDGAASMAASCAVAPGPHAQLGAARRHGAHGRAGRARSRTTPRLLRPARHGHVPDPAPRVATRADMQVGYSRLAGLRVLDLGAGGAPWTIAVLSSRRTATAVVNDLPGVIELAAETPGRPRRGRPRRTAAGDFHDVALEEAAYRSRRPRARLPDRGRAGRRRSAHRPLVRGAGAGGPARPGRLLRRQ